MKNLFIIFIIALPSLSGWAQVSVLGNSGSFGNYVGWDNTNAFPLEIRHNASQPISFFTNGTERMRLMESTGRLGWGLTNPANNVHIHHSTSPSSTTGLQLTNSTTGSTDEDGLLLGPNGTTFSELNWQESTPFRVRQHNTTRAWFHSYEYGGYNSLNPIENTNRLVLPLGWGFGTPQAGVGPIGINNTGFSILHMGLVPNENLRRPWLNIGTTYTAGADLFYTGLIQSPKPGSPLNHVDAVLAWGDNESEGVAGPDYFRILFFKPTDRTPYTDACQDQGRECMRITPWGNVGVGDFSHMASGLNEDPTHRLDVSGNARFRAVASEGSDVLITGHQEDAIGDYSLRYLAFSGNDEEFLAGDGTWQTANALCDWNIVNSGQDMATGYTGACVEGNVLIGNAVGPSTSKLFVVKQVPEATFSHIGAEVRLVGGQGDVRGVVSNASGQTTTTQTVGIFGTALTGQLAVGGRFEAGGEDQSDPKNVGVIGRGFNTGGGNATIGVYGRARNMSCGSPRVIGLYGQAIAGTDWTANSPTCGVGWALLTCGPVGSTTTPIILSDQSLKTDINNLTGASDLLSLLKPKTYLFNDEAINTMGASGELQYGFLAQEVAEVIPHLVGELPGPIDIDNPDVTGNTYKGIKYDELIPVLVAGHQEQQAIISAQQEAIAAQQAQIEALTALV